jgi:hypothetical protein
MTTARQPQENIDIAVLGSGQRSWVGDRLTPGSADGFSSLRFEGLVDSANAKPLRNDASTPGAKGDRDTMS